MKYGFDDSEHDDEGIMMTTFTNIRPGSRGESEVAGFFVFSQ